MAEENIDYFGMACVSCKDTTFPKLCFVLDVMLVHVTAAQLAGF